MWFTKSNAVSYRYLGQDYWSIYFVAHAATAVALGALDVDNPHGFVERIAI